MVESKPSAKPLGFYTKENAAFNVLQNTAITGALGGVTGTVVSVLRASPIQPAIAAIVWSKDGPLSLLDSLRYENT